MKYLSNINLTQNELQNAVIQNLATDPTGSKEGQIYYNTATDKLRVFDGTNWADVSASMSGGDIVTAINGSAGIIDLDNLAGMGRQASRHSAPRPSVPVTATRPRSARSSRWASVDSPAAPFSFGARPA